MDVIPACRCCLRCPPDKDLTTPYTHLGATEIYADMLKQCFDIQVLVGEDGPCGICSACVGRLRDASDFKLQVQHSQAELQAWLPGFYTLTKEEPTDESEMWDGDGASEEPELSEDPLAGPGLLGEDESPQGNLNEEPAIKSELLDEDGTSEKKSTEVKEELSDAARDEACPAPRQQLAMTCSVRLERLRSDEGHTSIHTGQKPYTCDHCGKQLRSKSTLRKHILYSHLSTRLKTFPCASSRSTYQTAAVVTEHKKSEHGFTNFVCSECEYTTVHKKSWLTHLKSHQMQHTDEMLYKCNSCEYKCRRRDNLKRHQIIHTGEKPYKCNSCNYKCRLIENLRRHELIHTGEKPYKCNSCKYKCRLKYHLRLHQMRHTGEKPYKCNSCEYKCRRRDSLKRHQIIHTGEELYKCNFCDYKCSQKGHLKHHQMIHTGDKPYKCDSCDYKCRRKEDIRRHQVKHTAEKPYFRCNHCNYATRFKHALKKHVKSH